MLVYRNLLSLIVLGATLLGAQAASAKLAHSPCTPRSKLPGCQKKRFSTELTPYTPKKRKDLGIKDQMTPKGKRARGFYLTPYYFHKVGAAAASRVMKRAHMNAVVIDMKGDLGRVLYPSKVPLSTGLQKHLVRDPKKALEIFHEQGIYVIARVVCFKDSRLPYKRPDLAVRIGRKSERLFSAGANWVDPYSPEVQDYIIDIAVELQDLGFDEIQFDYIRFPKGRSGTYARYLHQDDRPRAQLILDFLEKADRALGIPISVDVYGLTTLVDGDPRTLGQAIGRMAEHAEALSPMMYANAMDTYFKNNKVTEKVYHLLHCGLWRARKKAPNVVLRPFIQAFSDNVEHFFGPAFIKRQVEVAYQSGSDGFLFWNATMKNGTAYRALKQMGAEGLDKLAEDRGQYDAPDRRPGKWCDERAESASSPDAD